MTTNTPPPNTVRGWVGRNVRARRTMLGLTLEELAQRLTDRGYPLDKAQLSRIENGRANVDVEKLYALADSLETTTDRLLRDPAGIDAAYFAQMYERWRHHHRAAQEAEARAVALLRAMNELIAYSPTLRDEEAVGIIDLSGWDIEPTRVPDYDERHVEPGGANYGAFVAYLTGLPRIEHGWAADDPDHPVNAARELDEILRPFVPTATTNTKRKGGRNG